MSAGELRPVNVLPRLPRRAFDAHKGSFGKVLIVAGSRGMSGAAVLCGRAALRSGAGLVQVAAPANVQLVVAAGNPCYTTIGIHQHADGTYTDAAATDVVEWARAANALAIGPGLGHTPDVAALVKQVLRELPRTPTVVDADGLNVLAPFTEEFQSRPCPLILTPHPGEFCRLSGRHMPDVQAHREAAAVEFAGRFGVVLVLKGAGTIVTDGQNLYRNSTGNPGLATGGAGDVLTGAIAALLGQQLSPFEAAVAGVWVHGRAGDHAAATLGQIGLTAADVIECLPQAFQDLETD
jgi:ADP-dependent NAD(P)H-hydrate dehydratase